MMKDPLSSPSPKKEKKRKERDNKYPSEINKPQGH